MSDSQTTDQDTPTDDRDADAQADFRAILVVFCTAVLMAMHFVSGFTFDF